MHSAEAFNINYFYYHVAGDGPAPEKGREVAVDYCGTLGSHEEWSLTDVSEWVKAQQGMAEYAEVLTGASIDGKKLLGGQP